MMLTLLRCPTCSEELETLATAVVNRELMLTHACGASFSARFLVSLASAARPQQTRQGVVPRQRSSS